MAQRPDRRQARRRWLSTLHALLLVLGASLLGEVAQRFFSPTNLVMFYLLAVVVAAAFLGRGPSILVAALSVLVFDYFFVPPRFTLAVDDTEYLFTFVALFVVGLAISNLTAVTREQAEAAERRAAQNSELYALSRDLAASGSLEAILQAIHTHVGQTFRGRAEVRTADAAPQPGAVSLPLRTSRRTLGELRLHLEPGDGDLLPEQRQLLEAFASQAALAIEREQLAEQARQAEILQATERLQTALLNSITHDLRTPLVSIVGALSSLQEEGAEMDGGTRQSLVDNALGEADRLNRLVGNLLDMTRIESGALRLRSEPCEVEDLVGAALEALAPRLAGRPVEVGAAPGMPLVPLDFVLMQQVLINLLDNALKYSLPGTPIEVRAWTEGGELRLDVADRGLGIPPEDLGRVLDKFYRVHQAGSIGGIGLGLPIGKGIVEAHGGRLWLEARPGGGTLARLALPLGGGEVRP